MIFKTSIFLIIALFMTTAVAAYKDIWAGVDLEKVDWDKLCTTVKPVEYKSCAVVHPTSSLLSGNPELNHNRNPKEYPPNCKIEAKKFKQLKKANSFKCKLKFKSSFKNRVAHPEWFKQPLKEWKKQYFNTGIIR